jgi:aminopeptidase N
MRILIFLLLLSGVAYSQNFKNPVATAPGSDMPPLEPGVSQELAKWRAAHYSDVRYKLSLTLEKMSPVLKGSIEIRVKVSERPVVTGGSAPQAETRPVGSVPPIVLDWRKIRGHEKKSTISNVTLNGRAAKVRGYEEIIRVPETALTAVEWDEHLLFPEGVLVGENVIKLDFTSPILTSGSAITRYVDKEDGSEYIYSLFVPSDASTAFPVFDQPDLKAKFTLTSTFPDAWRNFISNEVPVRMSGAACGSFTGFPDPPCTRSVEFAETKPISTYVFAFAAGPWERVSEPPVSAGGQSGNSSGIGTSPNWPAANAAGSDKAADLATSIYVRKSQAAKFKPHAEEVFRLNREAVKYFEEYFNYKYPFPKYDLVLIPEFPFGGMEHAGATFLRESSIIFPQEPTKNDLVNRATLIFHETAHQWFGDTVTMRWFDDLWLKEGFATFMGYKALEKIMPEMNAWKVFYERIKQGAYQTDSTKGTTPIYQEIKNLSAAKSAYGNIVYNKAPAFLRQAEFYLGEDKFQTAVRAFLKKHEYANAGWEDLVKEFEAASRQDLKTWATQWVTQRGFPVFRATRKEFDKRFEVSVVPTDVLNAGGIWETKTMALTRGKLSYESSELRFKTTNNSMLSFSEAVEIDHDTPDIGFYFPNYQDYGYGIFLLDEKSRDYVLKNIQNETDPFLRSMMWGALWDSVREGELDPREYVELVIKVQSASFSSSERDKSRTLNEDDESTVALLLNRVGTAMNYYIDTQGGTATVMERAKTGDREARSITVASLPIRLENVLIERMQNAPTLGQRITFYRAFLNVASSENARNVLKAMLRNAGTPAGNERDSAKNGTNKDAKDAGKATPLADAAAGTPAGAGVPLKTKDKFDIVTRLLILNDPDAPKLLADLEKTETGDDAKRYAYAAKAGIPTAENKAKYWNDFVNNKEISESWIEAAMGPWNSIKHSEFTLPYLQKALLELPNHKRNRKIFFVNGWLGAFIGGQRSEEALAIVNKFLTDNPNLDNDLRLKILENVDLIERAVRIRAKYGRN